MNIFESVRISWRNIREHKLRSTLTTLGVIIGVAAVITFVTLGASLQQDIISTVAGGNAATMYVTAQSPSDSQVPSLGSSEQAVFTQHDVNQMRQLEGVRYAVPESGIAASSVNYNNSSVARQFVTVTSPDYFRVRDLSFVAGGPFEQGREEVVLNRPAARMFSGGNVSVGDNITFTRAVNGEQLNATVVGIVEGEGSGSVLGFEQGPQPRVYAPTEPYYQRTVYSPAVNARQQVYGRILVTARSPGQVDAVQGQVYNYLGRDSDARSHKPQNYEFKVTTQDQIVNQVKQLTNTFTAYITGIAVISLIVGSIGIANIMLVSVTERTREIGIMKAVGAQSRDVLQLFLLEAVMLGVLGSALGATVGLLGGYLGAEAIGLPLAFQPIWFGAAVLVGIVVGVLAGLYPAWDASKTDPIDALRYE
ncbi:ABC transporter permease (plasmid) [Halorussus salilacus]|uniref:ABC transporter permease n=1 Tax=Halorussus salilacus TaxID=2953750 RepID=UPI00209E9256|nr:ABC transporter permease [Halorussus salilacus]USZ69790.1 ABC transporter permease [Halorussus salilacus]